MILRKKVDRDNYVKMHGGEFKKMKGGKYAGMWKWHEGDAPVVKAPKKKVKKKVVKKTTKSAWPSSSNSEDE